MTAGSHRDLSGDTLFTEEADVMSLVDGESENSPSGLVAVCAPPGPCMLTDTRILHSGGRRTAEGTRYAMRIHCESADTFSIWPLLPTIFPERNLLTKSITVSDNRYFMRTLHEQAQQNLHVPEDTWELLSPRLRHMLGCSQFDHKPSL